MTDEETRYGLPIDQWDAAKAEIRSFLRNLARSDALITYGDMTAQLRTVAFHPGAYAFHALLREVCYEEDEAGHGMLCALVVSKADGTPGQGFFKAMALRGRDCSDPLVCWEQERAHIRRIWIESA